MFFRVASSSTFAICIPSSKILSNRQTVCFCLWIPWTQTMKILKSINDKYTFKTNVDNCDTTYTTYKHKHNMREVWARLHAVRCLVFFTHASHPHWLKAVHALFTFILIPSMMWVSLWVARLLLLPLTALHHLLVLPLHVLRQLGLGDKQPARLRQQDLRHLRQYLLQHRL